MKGHGKIWILYDSVTKKQSKPLTTLNAQAVLLSFKIKDTKRIHLWTPGWPEWVPLNTFLESDQKYFVIPPAPKLPEKPKDDDKTEVIQSSDLLAATILAASDEDAFYTSVLDEEQARQGEGKKVDYGYYFDDFHGDQVDPDASFRLKIQLPAKGSGANPLDVNRRSSPRHSFRIGVILISKNGKTFRSNSVNISLGGTLLEDELPKDFMNTRFDMILTNSFERDPSLSRLHFLGKVVGDYTNPRRLMFSSPDDHTLRRLKAMLKSYQDHQKKMKKKVG